MYDGEKKNWLGANPSISQQDYEQLLARINQLEQARGGRIMETLIILSYVALCVIVFRVFRVPKTKWTLTTASVIGMFIVGWIFSLHGDVSTGFSYGAFV